VSARSRSREAIARVAKALGEERAHVMFVGGTALALFDFDEHVSIRPTLDVDCVVDARSLRDYYAFVERLRARVFGPCSDEGAPLCRLVVDGIRVDVMGTVDTPVGPTNRWYADALATAHAVSLSDMTVRTITPLLFVATKLEAFHSRGEGRFVDSHDLEDLLTVIACMPDVRDAIDAAASNAARSIREELLSLAALESFRDAVWGHFEGDDAGQRRAALVLDWLRALAKV
jgi:predicted nucleotidyltransferase